jgi:peroxiredoxin Q/BCP
MLKEGTKIIDFSLVDQNNVVHKLSDYSSGRVLLYFYPKDDTPGCTTEACMIAEVYKDFKRLCVKVIGVSKDTPKSHLKFAEKYSLPFTLLSDPTMDMMDKYGALVMKKMYGKDVRGTNRISYRINPLGKIVKAYPDVDPANHALELLKDIKILKKEESK